jgi:hypothetical protein
VIPTTPQGEHTNRSIWGVHIILEKSAVLQPQLLIHNKILPFRTSYRIVSNLFETCSPIFTPHSKFFPPSNFFSFFLSFFFFSTIEILNSKLPYSLESPSHATSHPEMPGLSRKAKAEAKRAETEKARGTVAVKTAPSSPRISPSFQPLDSPYPSLEIPVAVTASK